MDSNVLVLGITFKENVPDIRNSKVIDIIQELKEFGINIHVYDPVADPSEVEEEYHIATVRSIDNIKYDAIILAVKHQEFIENGPDFYTKKLSANGILYDIKESFAG